MGGRGHLINIPKARTLTLNITLPNVLVCARLTLRSLLPHQRWAREIYILLASHKPLSQECQVWYGRVGKESQGRLLTLNPNTRSPDTQPRALTTHALARAEMPVSPQHWQPSRHRYSFLWNMCSFLWTSFCPLLSILFLMPKYPLTSPLSLQTSVRLLEFHDTAGIQSVFFFNKPACFDVYPCSAYQEFTSCLLLCSVLLYGYLDSLLFH